MSRVRFKDTRPEKMVRSLVFKMGYRYRLHAKNLPGHPDMVFPGRGKAIFIHGCFWHRHKGCPRCRMPKSRVKFWRDKLEGNARRDKKNQRALRKLGYEYLVLWECETEKPEKIRGKIIKFLESEQ